MTAAIKGLGITRKTLSALFNGKSGISPEMAVRLAKAFGSTPEVWLGIQMDYDLARVQRIGDKIKVQKLSPATLFRAAASAYCRQENSLNLLPLSAA